MPALDTLSVAVGATALAGVALALWGWRDIRDAFANEARANARARLGLDTGLETYLPEDFGAAASEISGRGGCNGRQPQDGTQHNGGTHNVAARKPK